MVIWITGLSGAGKTALCDAVLERVKPVMPGLVRLDGDAVRAIFGNSLGFSEAERVVQIKRIQGLAKELDSQGLDVLVAALYSHQDLLDWNRREFSRYFEIYLDTPLDVVKARDSKSLYAKAERGEIGDVVGVDIPWNPPQHPDLTLDGSGPTPAQLADRVIAAVPELRDAAAKLATMAAQ